MFIPSLPLYRLGKARWQSFMGDKTYKQAAREIEAIRQKEIAEKFPEIYGTEDAAVTGLTETALLNTGADWTLTKDPMALTTVPPANGYLYLVGSGGGTDATYTAGKLLISLWGY